MGAGRLPLASLGPGVGSPWQSRGQTLASALVSGRGEGGAVAPVPEVCSW